MDSESQPQGPSLSHFSQVQLVDIERQHSKVWQSIVENKTKLPSPHIRLYDKDGNFIDTRSFLGTDNASAEPQPNQQQISGTIIHTQTS